MKNPPRESRTYPLVSKKLESATIAVQVGTQVSAPISEQMKHSAALSPERCSEDEGLAISTGHLAPRIRQGIRSGLPVSSKESVVGKTSMGKAAKRAFWAENLDGTQGFQVEIKDELFENLRCSINILDNGKVEALFYVKDHNLRRLLEAEAGRLRVQLEERGLRVSEVRVVISKQDSE